MLTQVLDYKNQVNVWVVSLFIPIFVFAFWRIPIYILSDSKDITGLLFFLFSFFLALYGFIHRERLSKRMLSVWSALVISLLVVFGFRIMIIVWKNFGLPPEWDFLSFWVDGQVAAKGLNFYDPRSYQLINLPFQPSNYFTLEILQVGFRYPIPSMFIFLPLGYLDFFTGVKLWYFFNGIIAILDIYFLWEIFFSKEKNIWNLLIVAILFVMLSGTLSTIVYAQTNFFALFMMLLFWNDQNHFRKGLWLSIGIFIKPFLAFLLIYLFMRRHWKILAITIFIASMMFVLSWVTFGSETFFSYFTQNPNLRVPEFQFTEVTNQSLLSEILRVTNYDFEGRSPLTDPAYIALSSVFMMITIFIIYKLDDHHDNFAFVLVLLLSLLLYPSSQMFYSVLLIFPFLLLVTKRKQIGLSIWITSTFVAIDYAMISFWQGRYLFFANLFFWLFLVFISLLNISQNHLISETIEK